MSDYSELKRLAEAATPGPWACGDKPEGRFWHIGAGNQAIGSTYAASKNSSMASVFEANARFIAAANPAAVLALIAENERLQHFKTSFMEWSDKTDWVQETAHWSELGKHRADVLKDRIDQFKAENEALRRDAERYRWLRKTESWEEHYNRDGRLWIVSGREGVDNQTGEELDDSIDAAMAKEARP